MKLDPNQHYFVLMAPLEGIPGFICFKSSNSRQKFVECVIDESRYKLDDGYKVTFRALDENYGTETYYQHDAESLMKEGYIVPAEGKQCVEKKWIEPLTNAAYIVHSAYVLE